MNTNEKILNQLREKASELLPLTGIEADAILNAEQVWKYAEKNASWKYANGKVAFSADSFSMETGLRSLFLVLYRWESMMGVKHQRFETGTHKERMNFYCSYMKDGKPDIKRMELTQALPNLWYRELRYSHYDVFIKIHDTLAVCVLSNTWDFNPGDIKPIYSEAADDFKTFLLTKAYAIHDHIIEAYVRIQDYAFVQKLALRKIECDRAEEERQKEREEQRRINAEQEAERRRIEAERKEEEKRMEDERIKGEAEKFRNGEKISGMDIKTLCAIYGIDVHPRTMHTLEYSVVGIDGNGECQFIQQKVWKKGRYVIVKPNLDGCFEVAEQLYNRLNS